MPAPKLDRTPAEPGNLLVCLSVPRLSPAPGNKALYTGRYKATGNKFLRAVCFVLSLVGSFAQPQIGQHTIEILKELQYSNQVIFQSHSQISQWSGNETGAFLYHLCSRGL